MGAAGVFHEDDRVELIDGDIVEVAPIGPLHAGTVNRLNKVLIQRLDGRGIVGVKDPVRLSFRSEPQPDLVVLEPRDDFYARAHPLPEEVLLLIEVADASLIFDQHVKVPLYAQAGVRETWLVDLPAQRLVVHTEPTPSGYQQVVELRRGDTATPDALPDLVLHVKEILG